MFREMLIVIRKLNKKHSTTKGSPYEAKQVRMDETK